MAGFRSYLKRHWRGENSLAYAFWINYILAIVLVNVITENLYFAAQGVVLEVLIVSLLTIFKISVYVWSIVGVWCSAELSIKSAREAEPPASIFWGYAAGIWVIVAALALIWNVLVDFARLL